MEDKKQSLGHVKHLKLDITSPIKMKFDLEYNALKLYTGMNGTGKTVIMILTWIFSSLANFMILAKRNLIHLDGKRELQWLLDNSFSDQKTNGTISITMNPNEVVTAIMEEGKVISVEASLTENLLPMNQPIFMSKSTRLFEEIIKYMRLKKAMGIPLGLNMREEDMLKVLQFYKIYDIFFMEGQINNIKTRMTPEFLEKFNKNMEMFERSFALKGIRVSVEETDILISTNKNEAEVSISTLGAGHQSLINMTLASQFTNA